jgi:hypothetical protein
VEKLWNDIVSIHANAALFGQTGHYHITAAVTTEQTSAHKSTVATKALYRK